MSQSLVSSLECALCGKEFAPSSGVKTCPHCGVDGTMHVWYDYEKARGVMTRESLKKDSRPSLWRYETLLPVKPDSPRPNLRVGGTPLYSCAPLAERYGVKEVLIKDDGVNPTASFKDRASAIGVTMAMEQGMDVVACASTGNAASSLSGFAAVAGLKCVIFVPEMAPAAKVTQLLVYGADVRLVKGDYAATVNLAMEAIERWGWYDRNCAINPFLVEGKKTCAMEMAEQCGWNLPDYVFVSVGDGCIVSSVWKGFADLKALGFIQDIPKIVAVQAQGAAPIHQAIQSGASRVTFTEVHTVADSISVGTPRNWAKALKAVRSSGGTSVAVTDQEILSSLVELPRASGVFAEPAGVAAFAGFRKMARSGLLSSAHRVGLIVTGNGLKDVDSARKAVPQAKCIEPGRKGMEELAKDFG